ncbi:hypothetical protein NDU88_003099 [Pleurodeles waltl]|uniref:Uncharacterized protein n=1 Tax=Pleurodeles waltl TaxID=8319 RepID=A0AAV7NH58_PLEWA|nr:hypothetical protein NDU88_003099 [Pleurodeles waltl]
MEPGLPQQQPRRQGSPSIRSAEQSLLLPFPPDVLRDLDAYYSLRSPSESGRLYYVRMRRTVRMRTGDFVNFAVLNCSPQRALRKRMRALNFYRG